MKLIRIAIAASALTALVLGGVFAGAAGGTDAHADEPAKGQASIDLMTRSAANFIASLNDAKRQKALFEFENKERLIHRIAPFPIGGVPFAEMTRGQLSLVHTMLSAALSARGYHKAASIVALEEVLVAMDKERGGAVGLHGSEKYRVAVFGEPRPGGTWSWRIHGHHLCLAFTVVDGAFYAAGPAFLGAEPHRIDDGPHAGWSVLGAEEDLGRALMNALSEQKRTRATLADEMPRDMFSASYRKVDFLGPPKGIASSELSDEQNSLLRALVMEYVSNIPPDLAHTRLDAIERGGWENIHFGWIGSLDEGERIYYRVHGPEFLIEYCTVALSANHVHTVWRDLENDFGEDLLAEHYRNNPH